MMDSSHDGRGHHPSRAFSYESSSHGDRPASPPMEAPPNMMYYSPSMGYQPPPMALQGYPPGYDPYPNDYPPHSQSQVYHYPAGPYFSDPPTHHNAGGNKALLRGFLIFCCVIFGGLFLATLVMALMMHPKLPAYTVNSLSVANFNASTALTADWNTSFSIQNVNDKLNGFLSGFKVDLLHKNVILAMSYVPDFGLDKKEVKRIDAKMSSMGFPFPTSDMVEMAKDQTSGSVTVVMRIASMVEFKSETFTTRMSFVLAICDGLKVVFQNHTGNGALDNGGNPVVCQLYM
ncbi:uncharacterized protein LOC114165277 [Vigna unguiculata]|uniref:Late embryogenesis abundant protein n=1 Tax=Vigna unguiculata TaxID=3917 RepID=A0A4D6MCI6_VIGUN|nr:uncharacterized protein LOC114165277 [Vigna unguiculata]QCD98111.1 hypothetical protein DEO72_LG6g2828 [Vigna unguiculata]